MRSTPRGPATARPRFREHPVEFLLGIFGDMRPGEGGTALLLSGNVFLILFAYYLLKVAREPLILLGGGAEVKSYASVGQSVLLLFVANFYGWLASRIGRIALVTYVTLFFIGNLVLFWALGLAGAPLGVPFFLWVGLFNVVTVAQFWSFAADIYTEEQGKRLFPFLGIGASLGAITGSLVAEPLIRRGSPFTLMLVGAATLGFALAFTRAVHHREAGPTKAVASVHEPVGGGNAFALVLRDRYLLTFALLVLALNFVTKSGDYVFDRMLLQQAPENARALGLSQGAYIGHFKAQYFEWINALGLILQLFFVSRLVKYVGLRALLVFIPLVSLGGYGAALLFPLIGVLFVGRVGESSLDYSLSNTAQQTLWLTTTREAKYKAKQVIDSFFKRAGDTSSAALVWVGAHFALGLPTFLIVNVVVSLVWVGLAIALGREYAARVGSGEGPRSRAAEQVPDPPGVDRAL